MKHRSKGVPLAAPAAKPATPTPLPCSALQAEMVRNAFAAVQKAQSDFGLVFGAVLRGHGYAEGRFIGIQGESMLVQLPVTTPVEKTQP